MATPEPASPAAAPELSGGHETPTPDPPATLDASVFTIESSQLPPTAAHGDVTYSPQFSRSVRRVPVLHLFGYTATANGRRVPVCLHLHGALPYFLVPVYNPSVSAVEFGAQLELVALRVVFAGASHDARVVHHVEVTQAVPFYGAHACSRLFYKVFVYSPAYVARLANLLGSTTLVAGRRWQPYEAHTPFHFQCLMDLGVTGKALLKLRTGLVRRPAPAAVPLPAGMALQPDDVTKTTTALLEIDVSPKDLHAPGEERAAPGASMQFQRSLLRAYLRSIGKDASGILAAAIAPDTFARPAVSAVQNEDALGHLMLE